MIKQIVWSLVFVIVFLSFPIAISAQESAQSPAANSSLWPTVISAVSASVAVVTVLMTWWNNRKTLNESKRGERRKVVGQALIEFYGPLISYLGLTRTLSRLLFSNKPKEFRTLTYLLNPNQEYDTEHGKVSVTLTDSDRKLLAEIIETEKKIEDLIIVKGGLVDDPELMFSYIPDPNVTDISLGKDKIGLLPLAITHYRIIRMAHEGNFRDEAERFKNYVYPRELDQKVRAKYEALQKELKNIS